MKLLFIDLGNYCRSPVAEAMVGAELARHGLADRVQVSSAGIEAHHLGDGAHPMTVASASARGIDLSAHRCRQIAPDDFSRFDLILAVDGDSLARLQLLCPAAARGRLGLLLSYAPEIGLSDIPDPNRQAPEAFGRVLDLTQRAAESLVSTLRARL